MMTIIVIFFVLLVGMGGVSLVLGLRDAAVKRERLQHADVADGMPDEIENLPSNEDGSTGPA